jgi:hypothetical protein
MRRSRATPAPIRSATAGCNMQRDTLQYQARTTSRSGNAIRSGAAAAGRGWSSGTRARVGAKTMRQWRGAGQEAFDRACRQSQAGCRMYGSNRRTI